jgi:hypothetical protein
MKQNRDFAGLVTALGSKDPQVRVGAAEALKEIGDEQAIARLCGRLTQVLTYGLTLGLRDRNRVEALKKVHGRVATSESALREMFAGLAGGHLQPLVHWYALIASAECGLRDDAILNELIDYGDRLVKFLDEPKEDSMLTLQTVILGGSVRKETLRAISYFKDSPTATSAIIGTSEDRLFAGRDSDAGERLSVLKYEVYALGALGDISTRKRLEYWATNGEEQVQKRARIALELFGHATFDEIEACVKSKYGIE